MMTRRWGLMVVACHLFKPVSVHVPICKSFNNRLAINSIK